MGAPDKTIYEFGEWCLNVTEHLLLRRGQPVPLTPKAFDILIVLVENAGRLVSKDEFLKRVWPDAFVEEAVLAQNISVLRKTLGGDARLVETVPKLGYRFIAKVQVLADQHAESDQPTATGSPIQPAVRDRDSRSNVGFRKVAGALIGIAVLAIANISLQWISQPGEAKVLRTTALTTSGRSEPWGGITIDGSRIYFLERQGGRFQLMQTSIAGGEETQVASPYPNTRIFGLSPDNSQFLIGNFIDFGGHMPLSTWPAQGGAPHRIGDVVVDDAVWFPDGKHILYSYGKAVFSVDADGTNHRELFGVKGSALDFSWRPDGALFRFTVLDTNGGSSLWEAAFGENTPHPLLPAVRETVGECCGSWTPDGRNYVFSAFQNGSEDLWVLPESAGLFWNRKSAPLQLTNGPDGFSWPKPDKDGKRLYVFSLQYRRSAVRYDPVRKEFIPYRGSAPMFDFAFSRDGAWVAYVGAGESLWRSKIDGTEALQLTSPPLRALRPRWSPDGYHILFMGSREGTQSSAYVISANGGGAVPVLKEGTGNFAQADWSADGNTVVVDALMGSGPAEGVLMVDLQSHGQVQIPESKGKVYVRWSPDGRYLAARSEDEKKLFLFDSHSRQWKQLATAQYIPRHDWDANSRDLYFQDALTPAQTVFRVNVETGKVDTVFDFSHLLVHGAAQCTFEGRTPDGSFLASVRTSVSSIYSLDVQLP
jgi:DNA-binding winged helix-turn-helix (wHTH) protein/Tol biopolymer transport system component